ncbi:MAG: indolepyruvate ferredoxin oxidoreductase subunit beta [Thermoplasmata archaeon]|nr:MAG: indolepyruvate ferredoxin oxidoreductase subunit beta [Thermoplasmata archaeon]
MKVEIVLTGVGGQGVLTMASLLGRSAVRSGINVLVSEVHGMAQRGGSVKCTVRMGEINSPLIAKGSADCIVSTEPLEALREIEKANKDTVVLTDTNPVVPPSVVFEKVEYPDVDVILEEIRRNCKLYAIDANSLAKKAGDIISKNIVMLGALSALDILPFSHDTLLEEIRRSLPYKDINIRAFNLGREEILRRKNEER